MPPGSAVDSASQSSILCSFAATIACRAAALFSGIAKAAGKNLTVDSFGKAAAKGGTFDIPGSGKVTWDSKTKTFQQPVYIFRYDPTTKTAVRDDQPSS